MVSATVHGALFPTCFRVSIFTTVIVELQFHILCRQKWEQHISCDFTQLRVLWAKLAAEKPQPPS